MKREIIKKNEQCPSYDCGGCSTFPTKHPVQCGDKDTKNCKWLDFDFQKFANYSKTHCSHFVLCECSQEHHANCVGTDKCIKDLEDVIQKICNQYNRVVEQNKGLQTELLPLRTGYFKDLPINAVAELAKKSFILTTYQINAEELLDYILKTIKNASSQNAVRIIEKEINNFRKMGAR